MIQNLIKMNKHLIDCVSKREKNHKIKRTSMPKAVIQSGFCCRFISYSLALLFFVICIVFFSFLVYFTVDYSIAQSQYFWMNQEILGQVGDQSAGGTYWIFSINIINTIISYFITICPVLVRMHACSGDLKWAFEIFTWRSQKFSGFPVEVSKSFREFK